MTTDLKKLHQIRMDSLAASKNQRLPLSVRLGFKRAADKADAALSLARRPAPASKTSPQT